MKGVINGISIYGIKKRLVNIQLWNRNCKFQGFNRRPGVSDPSIENMGPIPPGWYIIYPSEIEEGNVNFLEKKR